METEASLVRADCAVELHAISGVCLNFTLVIHPGYAESEDTVRLDHTLYNLSLFEFRMLVIDLFYRFQYFLYSLKILFFSWILGLETGHYFSCFHKWLLIIVYFILLPRSSRCGAAHPLNGFLISPSLP